MPRPPEPRTPSRHPALRQLMTIVLPVLAGLYLVLFLSACYTARPTKVGVIDGRLAPCPDKPNCVSTQADPADKQHAIAPIPLTIAPDEAMRRLKAIVQSEPRTTIVLEQPNVLSAEFRTLLVRFVDDVDFYIDPAAKLIHFRSASRVGHGDLGVNRKRMEHLRERYETAP
jgi:uncharacterized protein (DUF1499 family)